MILINSFTIVFAYQYESNTNETEPNYGEIFFKKLFEEAVEKGLEMAIDKGLEIINNRIEIERLNSYIKDKKEKEAYQLLTKLIYEKK